MTINEARIKANMSCAEVAHMLGYPVKTVEAWDKGERNAPPFVEKRIVEELIRIANK